MNTLKQNKTEIGKRIRQLRTDLGMSQEELAKAVGYTKPNSRSTINKIEMGYNDIAQSKLPIYAKVLKVNVSYLLGIDDSLDSLDKKFNENQKLQKEVHTIEKIQRDFGKDAVKLLDLFNKLNKLGKKKAVETLEDLSAIPKYIEKEGE